MIARIMFLLICLFLSASLACATTFSGLVVKISDGDTIQVMLNGKAEKIRLAGIDTPEKKQPFGQAATRYNRSLSAHKIVTVKVETTDRYGRLVGCLNYDEHISTSPPAIKSEISGNPGSERVRLAKAY